MNSVKLLTIGPSSSSPHTYSLLKRHPKYFRKLYFITLDLENRKIFKKLQAMKIVKSLDIPCYESDIRHLVLSALKSQRNCLEDLNIKDPMLVKHFPSVSRFLVCSKVLDSWRVFLRLINLKKLTLECPYIKTSRSSCIGKIRSFYWRFWQHLEKLKVLEDFHICFYNQIDSDLLGFLGRLDEMEKKLGSLKNFSLFLSHMDVEPDGDLDFENVKKNLTSFRVHESSFLVIQKLLKNLKHFQKLESLNILKNLSHLEDENNTANFSYLKDFSQLTQIKTMDILINFGSGPNFVNFLEHFSIPGSIISLKLSFYEADWPALLSSNQLDNLKALNAFESHPLCLNFYNKWQTLNRLESLSLCFCERSSSDTPSLYFITPILRKLTTLKSLYFANWLNNFNHTPQLTSTDKIKALNLYHLWKALNHMKPTLKKLYIDSSAISLRKFPSKFELEDQEKLCLEEFGLCGLVLGDLYLEVLSKTLAKNESRFEVESIILDNNESMMKVMDLIVNISKKIRVSVSLDMRNIDAGDFMEMMMKDFVGVMKKPHITIDFHRIPKLSSSQLRAFRKMLNEYQQARLQKDGQERNTKGIHSSMEGLFGDFGGMTNGGSEGLSLGDEEDEWEESEEYYEEEMSEMAQEVENLLEDGFEEIDEDI